jgi:glycosyltransferase involved in cell wall biosynthesis
LKKNWFTDRKIVNVNELNFLYVGRLRVEKGIFSLIKIIENTNIKLTVVTSEKEAKLKTKNKNIKLISFENYNDAIINFYDQHSILILPSYTEAHPQVLDEALARNRPVIIFEEISHVKRNREGVFICERNIKSLENMVSYIRRNYNDILAKIKKNVLPTQENFINELKNILF